MARLTQWLMALAGLLTSASMSSCSRGNENEEPRPPVDTEQRVATPEKDGGVDRLTPADDASADEKKLRIVSENWYEFNVLDGRLSIPPKWYELYDLYDTDFYAWMKAAKAADSNDVSKVPGAYYGVPPAYESKFKFKSTPCTSRPNTRPLIPEVTGGRSRRVIQMVVRSHLREIRACFDNEFERNKKMGSGRVIVSWNIDEEGMVSGVTIKETELQNKRIEDCLVEAISSWNFSKILPKTGKSTHVEYPFLFESPTDDYCAGHR